jgi:hypothetical protein
MMLNSGLLHYVHLHATGGTQPMTDPAAQPFSTTQMLAYNKIKRKEPTHNKINNEC